MKEFTMNEATRRRLALARQIVPAYAQNPKLQAMTVTGEVARGWGDHHSKLEIDIFWQDSPSEAERRLILEKLGEHGLIFCPSKRGGWSETGDGAGIKIELSQFLVETIECSLADVIDQRDPDTQKQILIAAIQHSLPLHGAGLVESWQARSAVYPAELAQAVVQRNLQFNGRWSSRESLVERDELLLLYDLYCQVERQLLSILFGLNRLYLPYPDGKWLEQLTQEMAILPPALALRLKQVFRLAPRSGVRLLQELIDETLTLVEKHMPGVDTAEARRAIQ
jgi:hypothetical protein